MSSALKRKRGHDTGTGDGGSGGSRTGVQPTGVDAVNVSSTDTNVELRAHLEQSLVDLRASAARIEAVLGSLPAPPAGSRVPLTHVHAPAQHAQHAPPPATSPVKPYISTGASTPSCESCTALHTELSTLRSQLAQHQREREAWRAFKAWWLDSLAKRERKHRRHRDDTRGATESGRGGGGGRMDRVVAKLDADARRVWVDAGIVPAAVVEGGEEVLCGEEQSELTLPGLLPSGAGRAASGPGVAGGELEGVEGKAGDPRGATSDDVDGDDDSADASTASSALGLPSSPPSPKQSRAVNRRPDDAVGASGSAAGTARAAGDGASASKSTTKPNTLTGTGAGDRTTSTASRSSPNYHTHAAAATAAAAERDDTRTTDTGVTAEDTAAATHRDHRHASINRTTTLNPPSNAEAAYIDTSPIRNRLTRRTLHASACPDCCAFYAQLNSASTAQGRAEGDISRQACSRHRTTFARAHTPEGYWNIGFPSTQEAEAINAQARDGRRG